MKIGQYLILPSMPRTRRRLTDRQMAAIQRCGPKPRPVDWPFDEMGHWQCSGRTNKWIWINDMLMHQGGGGGD